MSQPALQDPSRQDRRAKNRHMMELPLAFRLGQGLTRNISSAGLLFSTLEPFKPHQRFSFTLMPYDQPPVHALAEVVRIDSQEGYFDVAVSFIVLTVDEPLTFDC